MCYYYPIFLNQEDVFKFARVFAFYCISVVFDFSIVRSNLMNLR